MTWIRERKSMEIKCNTILQKLNAKRISIFQSIAALKGKCTYKMFKQPSTNLNNILSILFQYSYFV